MEIQMFPTKKKISSLLYMAKSPVKKTNKKPYKKSVSIKKKDTNFTKKVVSIIHSNIENKTYQYNSDVVPVVNYNNTSWATYAWSIPLSPYTSFLDIPLATGQGGRIGNTIGIRKLTFKGILYPMPYNYSSNTAPRPHEVKFWIVHDKLNPCSGPASGSYTTFFQNGSSSATFTSNLLDMIKAVNQDRFVVHATRTFKVGYAQVSGTGPNVDNEYFSNNDFKFNHKFSFDLTKMMVKKVKYNDASQIPTTRGLFLIAEAVRADGSFSAGGQASEIPCSMQYQLNCVYEDA